MKCCGTQGAGLQARLEVFSPPPQLLTVQLCHQESYSGCHTGLVTMLMTQFVTQLAMPRFQEIYLATHYYGRINESALSSSKLPRGPLQ